MFTCLKNSTAKRDGKTHGENDKGSQPLPLQWQHETFSPAAPSTFLSYAILNATGHDTYFFARSSLCRGECMSECVYGYVSLYMWVVCL